MKSYTIYLIRHGTAQGNLSGQYIGVTDSPLAEQGKVQLQALVGQKAYPKVQGYYTSPLSRCTESLRLIYPQVQPIVVEDLRECDFGAWEGKSAKDLADDPNFAAWMQSGAVMAPPGGEDGETFTKRVTAAFAGIVQRMLKAGETSAVVMAHGGVIMAVLAAFGLPRAPFYDWMTEPGKGYALRITAGLWMREQVLEVFDTVPPRNEQERTYTVVDVAREAADRAFGQDASK